MGKRILMALAMIIAVGSLVFAGSQGETQTDARKITFMYQGTDQFQASYKAAVERFTAATGIEVEMRYAPHDVYHEQLAAAIAGDDLADVVQLDGPFLSSLAWGGVLVPVEAYIDQNLLADMTASNIVQCTYPPDGKMYAMGHLDSTVLLYANKSYLEKIGARIPTSVKDAWTLEEFDTYLAALAELPEVLYPLDIMRAYGVKSEWGTYGFYTAFISGGGGIMDRENWEADGLLNSPETIAVAEKFQEWAENGWLVPASAGANMVFNEQRSAAMAWCGNWYWAGAYPSMGDDLIALPLPDFGNGVYTPNASWIFGITKDADKEAAGQFISYMLQDQAFIDDMIKTGEFPGLKSWAARDPLYSTHMKIAAEQADYAIARPPHPAYPTITSAFMKAFANILDGADVEDELNDAAAEIDEDIRDNDGYPPFGK
ncbi:MAG: extracellular solute-binding protein [Spirochaetia bacterium]|nr:extracellular solute-binding protein [Spirochaetia bacterium]